MAIWFAWNNLCCQKKSAFGYLMRKSMCFLDSNKGKINHVHLSGFWYTASEKKNAKYVSPFNSSNFPFGCMPLKKRLIKTECSWWRQHMMQATNLEGTEWNLILKCKIKAGAKKRKSFPFFYMPSKFLTVTLLNI